jgi:histidinol-phosphatase (PHP family)
MFDYHHHSENSVDSTTPMADICHSAIDRGITEIAFTEHVDFIPEERNTGYFDYERYMRDIEACRQQFGDKLAVLAAAEIDYCPDFEDEIAGWLTGKDFDFVVGSVHYIRGKGNISEPRAIECFGDRPVEEAYREYFGIVRQSAESGLWDSLGHIDLVKRYGTGHYGPLDTEVFADEIDGILSAVIRTGMALEVNASGLRQGPVETYPGIAILARYRGLGGTKITVGSDSHTAEHTGIGADVAMNLVRTAGFDSILRFRGRKGTRVSIEIPEISS